MTQSGRACPQLVQKGFLCKTAKGCISPRRPFGDEASNTKRAVWPALLSEHFGQIVGNYLSCQSASSLSGAHGKQWIRVGSARPDASASPVV
jgi:hypothetical protein